MAAAVGAEVRTVGLSYDETLADLSEVQKAISEFKPKMITVVHCETPSGTLNPIDGLGRLKQEMRVPLLYVDAVSSIGGTPVRPDDWHIDLCLGGAQKCLSALPDTCFLSVSEAAWEVIDAVDYVGYDAIKPFKTAVEQHYFPYTPGWQATAGLNAGAEAILKEGLETCFKRHAKVAAYCRKRLADIDYRLHAGSGRGHHRGSSLPPGKPRGSQPRGLPPARRHSFPGAHPAAVRCRRQPPGFYQTGDHHAVSTPREEVLT
jgi:aspartate aminotransferase-like enzyme